MSYNTTETEATQLANELKVLCDNELGGEWGARVWENMGWHHSVNNNGCTISPSYERGYHCYLGDPDDQCSGYWAKWGETVREALINTLDEGSYHLVPLQKAHDNGSRILALSNLKTVEAAL